MQGDMKLASGAVLVGAARTPQACPSIGLVLTDVTHGEPTTRPIRAGRTDILSIFLGFITVVVLSLGTDEVFHLLRCIHPGISR